MVFILLCFKINQERDPRQRKIEITIKSRSRLKTAINNQHTTTDQIMKFSILSVTAVLASFEHSSAFAPLNNSNRNNVVVVNMAQPGMDLSGNSWQPDSEKMGVSTVDNYMFYYY